ncbi:MAG: hypothetical protein IPF57_09130 [Gammaproteobacteria bacterium]|jgi:hypothetical protein|nr:hypothetical protein [Gammaproteobacteria bacterium]MBK9470032.1 hypothetical protein [Gammaproteobacteria bacterium]
MHMLRKAVVDNLTRPRLIWLSVQLGIFDARDLPKAELRARFVRSRLFDNETMLYGLKIDDLRSVAASLDIDIARVPRKDLINQLLTYRRKSAPKPKTKPRHKTKNKVAPESELGQALGDECYIPTGVSEANDGEGANQTERDIDAKQRKSEPGFKASDVPPHLFACRHMWLYEQGPYWVLSSRNASTVSVFDSKESAKSWHKAFDEFRGFKHTLANIGYPPGFKGSLPNGKIRPPGLTDESDTADSEQIAAPPTTDEADAQGEEDTPDTLYECPVCQAPVALRDAKSHLKQHRVRREIKPVLKDWIRGLEDAARAVLAKGSRRGGDSGAPGKRREAGGASPSSVNAESIRLTGHLRSVRRVG